MATRVQALRDEMRREEIDIYLVPSSDAHQSEYVPEPWQRRVWASGFTGSMGDAAVGLDEAWQWADSRYWLQGERELEGTDWTLMRQGADDVPSLSEFLGKVAKGTRVGFDPRLVGVAQARRIQDAIKRAGGELVAIDENLIDRVWTDRPALSANPIEVWDTTYAGQSVADKLSAIRGRLEEAGCTSVVLTTLDAIAYLFNIRGADVDFNPIVIAYAVVTLDGATLFVDPAKVTDAARSHFDAANVTVAPYDAVGAALVASTGKAWVDTKYASRWVLDRLSESDAKVHKGRSPVFDLRARKNDTESQGMRDAHVRDAVAVCRFLHWLETAWQGGDLDEIGASDQLEAFRSEGERFRGLSFDTISGFAGNGAVVHYRATPETAKVIDDSTLYLCDSGGQYLDGTTDITRTVHLGTPTEAERLHYTLVLLGHLRLRHTRFPKGTTGERLDAIARQPLWAHGLDYGHGTGHGVGCYLSVHQGPHGISQRPTGVPLAKGMVVSNEPGYYLAGRYGIRVENLCIVVEKDADDGATFFGFDDLTLVPYARKLIAVEHLNEQERGWVNDYNALVRETVEPLLPEEVRPWLRAETAPI